MNKEICFSRRNSNIFTRAGVTVVHTETEAADSQAADLQEAPNTSPAAVQIVKMNVWNNTEFQGLTVVECVVTAVVDLCFLSIVSER
jgi:hypothetical protein